MKIQVLSDIHFAHHADDGKKFLESLDPKDVDVLVLAGDIAEVVLENGTTLQNVLTYLSKVYPNVVYVPGNHEFYTITIEKGVRKIKEMCAGLPNVHFLHNELTIINGVKFYGGTAWFPENKITITKAKHFSDFHFVGDLYSQHNKLNAQFIQDVINNTPDVVISHHAPSFMSVHPDFRGDPFNMFYCNNWDEQINGVKLWIHGHIHYKQDYHIGNDSKKTRVVCNPIGYPGEYPKSELKFVVNLPLD